MEPASATPANARSNEKQSQSTVAIQQEEIVSSLRRWIREASRTELYHLRRSIVDLELSRELKADASIPKIRACELELSMHSVVLQLSAGPRDLLPTLTVLVSALERASLREIESEIALVLDKESPNQDLDPHSRLSVGSSDGESKEGHLTKACE
jgi:hypothetical protein